MKFLTTAGGVYRRRAVCRFETHWLDHACAASCLCTSKLIHTATPDTTKDCLPVDRHRDAGQAARPPTRSDVVRHENVNTLWTVAYD